MRPTEIIEARERLGLTQSEVAHRARVSEQTVSRIERGIRVRPNSLKDVYAVLGLAYEPLDTIELVMPNRLIDDPGTQIMRRAAQDLPQIEYLMRPDPRAWADDVKARLRKNPIRTSFSEGYAIIAIMVVLLIIIKIFWIFISLSFYNLGIFYAALILCPLLLISSFGALGLWLCISDQYDELIRCPDRPCGYAISEDAIWKMNVDKDRIRLKRISLTDCVWRETIKKGPFIEIRVRNGEEVDELDRMPAHPGIIALIERPRTNDRERTLPLPVIHLSAA